MEFGETLLKAMDESGVALQVVSHAPLALDLATCVKVNNELYDRMRSRPGRLRGLQHFRWHSLRASPLRRRLRVCRYFD